MATAVDSSEVEAKEKTLAHLLRLDLMVVALVKSALIAFSPNLHVFSTFRVSNISCGRPPDISRLNDIVPLKRPRSRSSRMLKRDSVVGMTSA